MASPYPFQTARCCCCSCSLSPSSVRALTHRPLHDTINQPPAHTTPHQAYYPTAEEQEAAAGGFDFANPEAWLEKAAKGEVSRAAVGQMDR